MKRLVPLLAALVVALSCAPSSPAASPTEPVEGSLAASPSPATGASVSTPPSLTLAPAPTPIAVVPCAGPSDPAVRAFCPKGVRVDIDTGISDEDAGAILAQISADLVALQVEFEREFRGTPRIGVYATGDRYAAGLRDVFGYSQATAEYLRDNSVAFFEPSLGRIAVSWSEIRDRRPIAAIRHELTHFMTLDACAPRCDLVPAWFNEGEARLQEALIPGADWRMLRVRYEAASMVATNTLLSLTALWTQAQWNAYGDWEGYYKYQEAARAVALIREDIGASAIPKIYARLRAGQDFASAYHSLSGRSFASFTASLPARLSTEIAPGPAIALVTPGADGTGASFLLYGFPAEAKVALRIHAHGYDETQDIAVSPQGAYFGSIDASYPPGAYTITAASGSTAAAVTVIKRGGRAVRALRD